MTAASATQSTSTGARAGILVATVAVAVALNALVAAIATAAGAPASWAPLTLPVFGAFTVVPLVIGWFAWRFVAQRVRNPRRTMPMLALAVLVLSFIPDIVLLATGFIPGTTTAGVIALMTMHVVVIGTAVAGYTLASRR
ncbi:hypothetical protein GCM10009775_12970 [Microbacterium aoyamense]|uniref:Uncharacterized protein n=1 Tax=Microbacterium aoyamense TaxID=344166 RepID=A0ABN2PHE3_9MICO|nr:DUF6069 family protein [Microbacterium aoyamense]